MKLGHFQKQIKVIILIIILLIGFGVTAFLGRNAATLFLAKATSCPVSTVSQTQVTANGAVVTWKTSDVSQGRVEYGTNKSNLAFTAPETSSGRDHSIPINLLTPNTKYYYVISLGVAGKIPGTSDTIRCDGSGHSCQVCEPGASDCTNPCEPFQFVTTTIIAPTSAVEPINDTKPTSSTASSATGAPVSTISQAASVSKPPASNGTAPQPSGSISAFCQNVKMHLGSTDKIATKWASVKQYDIDSNGIINGVDIIKCEKSGK